MYIIKSYYVILLIRVQFFIETYKGSIIICSQLQIRSKRDKTSLRNRSETIAFSRPVFTETNFSFTLGSTTTAMVKLIPPGRVLASRNPLGPTFAGKTSKMDRALNF